MRKIIEMGKENKIFSLTDVADLFYGPVEYSTVNIDWDKKNICRKFLWRTHNFSAIADEDRQMLVKAMVKAGRTEVLDTRILCFLQRKMLLPHLTTGYTFVCKREGSFSAIPSEIIRWHILGVPPVDYEKIMVKRLLLAAQKENNSPKTKICMDWLKVLLRH